MQVTDRHLRWIRPPQQARTQKTLVDLLDAATELLAAKGFEDVSVAEIARRADSSVGGFYRRFTDKDALLHSLHERYCEEAFATADVALDPVRWEGAGVREILSELVAFLVEVFRTHRGLDRAIRQRALSDPRFEERSARLSLHVMGRLSELLLARRREIHHPNPEAGVKMALFVVFSVLNDFYTVAGPAADLLPFSDERLAAELTHNCLQHLGVRTADALRP